MPKSAFASAEPKLCGVKSKPPWPIKSVNEDGLTLTSEIRIGCTLTRYVRFRMLRLGSPNARWIRTALEGLGIQVIDHGSGCVTIRRMEWSFTLLEKHPRRSRRKRERYYRFIASKTVH